jgi:hypothetical protein
MWAPRYTCLRKLLCTVSTPFKAIFFHWECFSTRFCVDIRLGRAAARRNSSPRWPRLHWYFQTAFRKASKRCWKGAWQLTSPNGSQSTNFITASMCGLYLATPSSLRSHNPCTCTNPRHLNQRHWTLSKANNCRAQRGTWFRRHLSRACRPRTAHISHIARRRLVHLCC